MAKFFVDAFADTFGSELKQNGLELAPSKIKCGSKIINFTGWDNANQKSFLENLIEKKYTIEHTTQQEWVDFFTPYLESGEDIAFFTISLKLFTDGGCDLQSAFTQLSTDFPKRKIKLIDTLTVSRGTSEIATLSRIIYKKNKDFEKAILYATKLAGQFVTAFVVDDVRYITTNPILKKAGSELVGGLLNIKPIISIDKEGDFKLLDKARGFKAGVKKLFSIAKANGENIADFTFSIVHSQAQTEAEQLREQFLPCINKEEIKIVETSLNNTIIVGPKLVGLTFHAK